MFTPVFHPTEGNYQMVTRYGERSSLYVRSFDWFKIVRSDGQKRLMEDLEVDQK